MQNLGHGSVTITAPRVDFYDYNKGRDILVKSIDPTSLTTVTYPPESTIAACLGIHNIPKTHDKEQFSLSYSEYMNNVGAISAITGKNRKLKADFDQSRADYEAAKIKVPITKIYFAEQVFVIPIAHDFLRQAFNTARAGYDVKVLCNGENADTYQIEKKPLAAYRSIAALKAPYQL